MSVDLRTTLNACDSATGFLGDGPTPTVNTTTGQRYEGSGSIQSQHTNADEHMYTSSIGGTRDLSASTVYWLLKDNLVDTFANGGIQGVLSDSTDRIGYDMAGNNAPGLDLVPFYRCYKLDVSVVVATPGTFNAYAGTEANLDQTAITEVGIGTLHLAKAVGNVANIFLDRMSFHLNSGYALRINGGTSGTPEATSDVQGDDITSGWGLVNQAIPGVFGFFGSMEWGEPAANADSYFLASDETWIFIGDNSGGKIVAAGNFKFRLISNATDTQSFVLNSVVLLNVGVRAPFDFSDANFDIVKLTSCTFNNWGVLTFPAFVATDKFLDACIFNNCDQVFFNDMDASNCIFNGSNDADGALLVSVDGSTDSQPDMTFNSDGTGHGVEITTPGDYTFDGWLFNGYSTASPGSNPTASTGSTDAMVYNNSGGAVTISIVGGGTNVTVRNAASSTTTVVAAVTVAFTFVDNETGDPIEGISVILGTAGSPLGVNDIIDNLVSNASGVVSVSYSGATPTTFTGFAAKGSELPVYKRSPLTGTIGTGGLSTTVSMVPD